MLRVFNMTLVTYKLLWVIRYFKKIAASKQYMILTLIYVKDIVLLPHTYEYIRNLTRYRKDASQTIDVEEGC